MEIDKILNIIQRKVLKGTHLPITIKEIQMGYQNSPYFKDLYLFFTQNKLSSSKSAICKVETLAEKYILCCVIQNSFVRIIGIWSELYIFPLPTCIFAKIGKTGNACFHRAELTLCFSDQVLVLLCLPRSIKGTCLLT